METLPKRQWLRPAEVASFIGVSPRTVCRLCETGKLIGFKVGDGPNSALRIQRASVQTYITDALRAYSEANGTTTDEF